MEFAIRHLSFDRCSMPYIHWDVSKPHYTFYYYKIDDDDDQICEIQLRIQLLPIHHRTESKSQDKEFNKRVDELHRNEDVSILSQREKKNTSHSIWLRCILFAFFNEQNKIYRRHHRLIIIQ